MENQAQITTQEEFLNLLAVIRAKIDEAQELTSEAIESENNISSIYYPLQDAAEMIDAYIINNIKE